MPGFLNDDHTKGNREMNHFKSWITENIRPEARQPKNAAGIILITVAFILAMWDTENNQSEIFLYIAAVLYVIGMILILIPGRGKNQDDDGNHTRKE